MSAAPNSNTARTQAPEAPIIRSKPSKGGAPVGNRNALRHGLKSAKDPLRTRVGPAKRLRAEIKRDLLRTWPHLSPSTLRPGIRLNLYLRQMDDYLDKVGGIISPRGQVRSCEGAMDRLTGRWEAWMKRADEEEARWKENDNPFGLM